VHSGKCPRPTPPANAEEVKKALPSLDYILTPFAGMDIPVVKDIKIKLEAEVQKQVIDFGKKGLSAQAAVGATIVIADAAFAAEVFVAFNWPKMKDELIAMGKWTANVAIPVVKKYVPKIGQYLPEKVTELELEADGDEEIAADTEAEKSEWRQALEEKAAVVWDTTKWAASKAAAGTKWAYKEIIQRSSLAVRVDFGTDASVGGLLPFICNDFTNAIHFQTAAMYYATADGMIDPGSKNYKIGRGISVMGTMKIEAYAPMKSFLKSASMKVEMNFVPPIAAKNQTEWQVKYAGSTAFAFPDGWPLLSKSDLFMTVDYNPNHAKGLRTTIGGGMAAELKIGASVKGGYPKVYTKFSYIIEEKILTLEGGLKSCWEKPFNVPNFKLCDVTISALVNMTANRLESISVSSTMDAKGSDLKFLAPYLKDPKLKVVGSMKRDTSAGAVAGSWSFEFSATTYLNFPEDIPLAGGEVTVKFSYSFAKGMTIGGDAKIIYLLNNPVPKSWEGKAMANPTFYTGLTYNLKSFDLQLRGGMLGCWTNAFTLDGFNICNIKATVDLALAKPPTGWCKGFSLAGEINMDGKVMEPLKKYLGAVTLKLEISMTNKMPAGWDMTAFAGVAFKLPESWPVSKAEFGFTLKYLTGTPPSFAVGFKGSMFFNLGATPPKFQVEVLYNVVTTSLTFDADMVGCWKNAFDIAGLDICDVGLGMGINLAQAAASGGLAAISYFRIQGAIAFGTGNDGKPTFFALLISVNTAQPTKSALLCVLDGRFAISDLVIKAIEMATNGGRNLEGLRAAGAAFPFYIEDVEIRAAMSKITIGGRTYEPGLAVKATLNFFSIVIKVDISLGMTGLTAKLTISPINIFGMLEVTGKGADMIKGTADDGAIFSLELTLSKQALFISGEATALGLFTVGMELSISKHGFYFMATCPFGSGLYKATIIAQTKNSDFLLDITIEMTFSDDIVKKAKEMAKDTKQKIDKAAETSSNAIKSVADDVASGCKSAGVYAATMDIETGEGVKHSMHRVIRRMQKKALPAEEFALIQEEEDLPEMTAEEIQDLATRAGYYADEDMSATDITDDEIEYLGGFDARAFGVRFRVGTGSALANSEFSDDAEAMLAIEQGWWGPVGKWVKKTVVEPVVKVVKVVVDWVGDAIKAAVKFITNVWNQFVKGLKAIGKALLKAACWIAEKFLSEVVANVVKYALKGTAWIVWAGITFAAKAYEWFTSVFSIQKAQYEGSLKQMLKLNFGTITLTVRVGGTDYVLRISLDPKEWIKMLWAFAKKVWSLLFPSEKGMPEDVTPNSDVFAKRCEISQPFCRRHPQYAGTRTDTDNARSSQSESACRKRARDWHSWCGNEASTGTTVNYYAAASKTVAFYPPRCWVNLSTCYTNKISSGGRSVWSKWDLESCFKVAKTYYETCGNRKHEWIDVEFNDGMSSTAKRFP
jgi:hypothetical protein